MTPPEIYEIMGEIFELGDKGRGYPPGGGADKSWHYHLGKAVGHIGKLIWGCKDEPHLYCAMWRLCIAATLYRRIVAISEIRIGDITPGP